MLKNNKYQNYTKEELIAEIERLKLRKKYGLVWEDKPEKVVEECKDKLPVLKEVKNKEIRLKWWQTLFSYLEKMVADTIFLLMSQKKWCLSLLCPPIILCPPIMSLLSKEGWTVKVAGPKADGLYKYIQQENKKGKRFFGGIATITSGRWIYFDKESKDIKDGDFSNWTNLNF